MRTMDFGGETFARTQANQRRCPECRAARPGLSPDAHARRYARTGRR